MKKNNLNGSLGQVLSNDNTDRKIIAFGSNS